MSIPNIFNKIKEWTGIDTQTFLYVCVVIGVGVIAFAFGRLSVGNTSRSISPVRISNDGLVASAQKSNNALYAQTSSPSGNNSSQFSFVASKNGKLYYTASCTGAKRIKDENKVWFSSAQEAESGGYTRSSSCK